LGATGAPTGPAAAVPRAVDAVTPILGIVFALLMMCSLPRETWLRLVIWLVAGLVIYFRTAASTARYRRGGAVGN